jgi:hypothetical protein
VDDIAHETAATGHDSRLKDAAEMRNRITLVPDARLARLASERGPTSAEAYVMLELREVRSAGDDVFAFQTNGRYIVRAAPKSKF